MDNGNSFVFNEQVHTFTRSFYHLSMLFSSTSVTIPEENLLAFENICSSLTSSIREDHVCSSVRMERMKRVHTQIHAALLTVLPFTLPTMHYAFGRICFALLSMSNDLRVSVEQLADAVRHAHDLPLLFSSSFTSSIDISPNTDDAFFAQATGPVVFPSSVLERDFVDYCAQQAASVVSLLQTHDSSPRQLGSNLGVETSGHLTPGAVYAASASIDTDITAKDLSSQLPIPHQLTSQPLPSPASPSPAPHTPSHLALQMLDMSLQCLQVLLPTANTTTYPSTHASPAGLCGMLIDHVRALVPLVYTDLYLAMDQLQRRFFEFPPFSDFSAVSSPTPPSATTAANVTTNTCFQSDMQHPSLVMATTQGNSAIVAVTQRFAAAITSRTQRLLQGLEDAVDTYLRANPDCEYEVCKDNLGLFHISGILPQFSQPFVDKSTLSIGNPDSDEVPFSPLPFGFFDLLSLILSTHRHILAHASPLHQHIGSPCSLYSAVAHAFSSLCAPHAHPLLPGHPACIPSTTSPSSSPTGPPPYPRLLSLALHATASPHPRLATVARSLLPLPLHAPHAFADATRKLLYITLNSQEMLRNREKVKIPDVYRYAVLSLSFSFLSILANQSQYSTLRYSELDPFIVQKKSIHIPERTHISPSHLLRPLGPRQVSSNQENSTVSENSHFFSEWCYSLVYVSVRHLLHLTSTDLRTHTSLHQELLVLLPPSRVQPTHHTDSPYHTHAPHHAPSICSTHPIAPSTIASTTSIAAASAAAALAPHTPVSLASASAASPLSQPAGPPHSSPAASPHPLPRSALAPASPCCSPRRRVSFSPTRIEALDDSISGTITIVERPMAWDDGVCDVSHDEHTNRGLQGALDQDTEIYMKTRGQTRAQPPTQVHSTSVASPSAPPLPAPASPRRALLARINAQRNTIRDIHPASDGCDTSPSTHPTPHLSSTSRAHPSLADSAHITSAFAASASAPVSSVGAHAGIAAESKSGGAMLSYCPECSGVCITGKCYFSEYKVPMKVDGTLLLSALPSFSGFSSVAPASPTACLGPQPTPLLLAESMLLQLLSHSIPAVAHATLLLLTRLCEATRRESDKAGILIAEYTAALIPAMNSGSLFPFFSTPDTHVSTYAINSTQDAHRADMSCSSPHMYTHGSPYTSPPSTPAAPAAAPPRLLSLSSSLRACYTQFITHHTQHYHAQNGDTCDCALDSNTQIGHSCGCRGGLQADMEQVKDTRHSVEAGRAATATTPASAAVDALGVTTCANGTPDALESREGAARADANIDIKDRQWLSTMLKSGISPHVAVFLKGLPVSVSSSLLLVLLLLHSTRCMTLLLSFLHTPSPSSASSSHSSSPPSPPPSSATSTLALGLLSQLSLLVPSHLHRTAIDMHMHYQWALFRTHHLCKAHILMRRRAFPDFILISPSDTRAPSHGPGVDGGGAACVKCLLEWTTWRAQVLRSAHTHNRHTRTSPPAPSSSSSPSPALPLHLSAPTCPDITAASLQRHVATQISAWESLLSHSKIQHGKVELSAKNLSAFRSNFGKILPEHVILYHNSQSSVWLSSLEVILYGIIQDIWIQKRPLSCDDYLTYISERMSMDMAVEAGTGARVDAATPPSLLFHEYTITRHHIKNNANASDTANSLSSLHTTFLTSPSSSSSHHTPASPSLVYTAHTRDITSTPTACVPIDKTELHLITSEIAAQTARVLEIVHFTSKRPPMPPVICCYIHSITSPHTSHNHTLPDSPTPRNRASHSHAHPETPTATVGDLLVHMRVLLPFIIALLDPTQPSEVVAPYLNHPLQLQAHLQQLLGLITTSVDALHELLASKVCLSVLLALTRLDWSVFKHSCLQGSVAKPEGDVEKEYKSPQHPLQSRTDIPENRFSESNSQFPQAGMKIFGVDVCASCFAGDFTSLLLSIITIISATLLDANHPCFSVAVPVTAPVLATLLAHDSTRAFSAPPPPSRVHTDASSLLMSSASTFTHAHSDYAATASSAVLSTNISYDGLSYLPHTSRTLRQLFCTLLCLPLAVYVPYSVYPLMDAINSLHFANIVIYSTMPSHSNAIRLVQIRAVCDGDVCPEGLNDIMVDYAPHPTQFDTGAPHSTRAGTDAAYTMTLNLATPASSAGGLGGDGVGMYGDAPCSHTHHPVRTYNTTRFWLRQTAVSTYTTTAAHATASTASSTATVSIVTVASNTTDATLPTGPASLRYTQAYVPAYTLTPLLLSQLYTSTSRAHPGNGICSTLASTDSTDDLSTVLPHLPPPPALTVRERVALALPRFSSSSTPTDLLFTPLSADPVPRVAWRRALWRAQLTRTLSPRVHASHIHAKEVIITDAGASTSTHDGTAAAMGVGIATREGLRADAVVVAHISYYIDTVLANLSPASANTNTSASDNINTNTEANTISTASVSTSAEALLALLARVDGPHAFAQLRVLLCDTLHMQLPPTVTTATLSPPSHSPSSPSSSPTSSLSPLWQLALSLSRLLSRLALLLTAHSALQFLLRDNTTNTHATVTSNTRVHGLDSTKHSGQYNGNVRYIPKSVFPEDSVPVESFPDYTSRSTPAPPRHHITTTELELLIGTLRTICILWDMLYVVVDAVQTDTVGKVEIESTSMRKANKHAMVLAIQASLALVYAIFQSGAKNSASAHFSEPLQKLLPAGLAVFTHVMSVCDALYRTPQTFTRKHLSQTLSGETNSRNFRNSETFIPLPVLCQLISCLHFYSICAIVPCSMRASVLRELCLSLPSLHPSASAYMYTHVEKDIRRSTNLTLAAFKPDVSLTLPRKSTFPQNSDVFPELTEASSPHSIFTSYTLPECIHLDEITTQRLQSSLAILVKLVWVPTELPILMYHALNALSLFARVPSLLPVMLSLAPILARSWSVPVISNTNTHIHTHLQPLSPAAQAARIVARSGVQVFAIPSAMTSSAVSSSVRTTSGTVALTSASSSGLPSEATSSSCGCVAELPEHLLYPLLVLARALADSQAQGCGTGMGMGEGVEGVDVSDDADGYLYRDSGSAHSEDSLTQVLQRLSHCPLMNALLSRSEWLSSAAIYTSTHAAPSHSSPRQLSSGITSVVVNTRIRAVERCVPQALLAFAHTLSRCGTRVNCGGCPALLELCQSLTDVISRQYRLRAEVPGWKLVWMRTETISAFAVLTSAVDVALSAAAATATTATTPRAPAAVATTTAATTTAVALTAPFPSPSSSPIRASALPSLGPCTLACAPAVLTHLLAQLTRRVAAASSLRVHAAAMSEYWTIQRRVRTGDSRSSPSYTFPDSFFPGPLSLDSYRHAMDLLGHPPLSPYHLLLSGSDHVAAGSIQGISDSIRKMNVLLEKHTICAYNQRNRRRKEGNMRLQPENSSKKHSGDNDNGRSPHPSSPLSLPTARMLLFALIDTIATTTLPLADAITDTRTALSSPSPPLATPTAPPPSPASRPTSAYASVLSGSHNTQSISPQLAQAPLPTPPSFPCPSHTTPHLAVLSRTLVLRHAGSALLSLAPCLFTLCLSCMSLIKALCTVHPCLLTEMTSVQTDRYVLFGDDTAYWDDGVARQRSHKQTHARAKAGTHAGPSRTSSVDNTHLTTPPLSEAEVHAWTQLRPVSYAEVLSHVVTRVLYTLYASIVLLPCARVWHEGAVKADLQRSHDNQQAPQPGQRPPRHHHVQHPPQQTPQLAPSVRRSVTLNCSADVIPALSRALQIVLEMQALITTENVSQNRKRAYNFWNHNLHPYGRPARDAAVASPESVDDGGGSLCDLCDVYESRDECEASSSTFTDIDAMFRYVQSLDASPTQFTPSSPPPLASPPFCALPRSNTLLPSSADMAALCKMSTALATGERVSQHSNAIGTCTDANMSAAAGARMGVSVGAEMAKSTRAGTVGASVRQDMDHHLHATLLAHTVRYIPPRDARLFSAEKQPSASMYSTAARPSSGSMSTLPSALSPSSLSPHLRPIYANAAVLLWTLFSLWRDVLPLLPHSTASACAPAPLILRSIISGLLEVYPAAKAAALMAPPSLLHCLPDPTTCLSGALTLTHSYPHTTTTASHAHPCRDGMGAGAAAGAAMESLLATLGSSPLFFVPKLENSYCATLRISIDSSLPRQTHAHALPSPHAACHSLSQWLVSILHTSRGDSNNPPADQKEVHQHGITTGGEGGIDTKNAAQGSHANQHGMTSSPSEAKGSASGGREPRQRVGQKTDVANVSAHEDVEVEMALQWASALAYAAPESVVRTFFLNCKIPVVVYNPVSMYTQPQYGPLQPATILFDSEYHEQHMQSFTSQSLHQCLLQRLRVLTSRPQHRPQHSQHRAASAVSPVPAQQAIQAVLHVYTHTLLSFPLARCLVEGAQLPLPQLVLPLFPTASRSPATPNAPTTPTTITSPSSTAPGGPTTSTAPSSATTPTSSTVLGASTALGAWAASVGDQFLGHSFFPTVTHAHADMAATGDEARLSPLLLLCLALLANTCTFPETSSSSASSSSTSFASSPSSPRTRGRPPSLHTQATSRTLHSGNVYVDTMVACAVSRHSNLTSDDSPSQRNPADTSVSYGSTSNKNISYTNLLFTIQWLLNAAIVDSSQLRLSLSLSALPSSSYSPRSHAPAPPSPLAHPRAPTLHKEISEMYRTFTKIPSPTYPPALCIPPPSISRYFTYVHAQPSSDTVTTILPHRRLPNDLLPQLWRYITLIFTLSRLPSSHQTPLFTHMDQFLPLLLYAVILPYPDITHRARTRAASPRPAPSYTTSSRTTVYIATGAAPPRSSLRADVHRGIVTITPSQQGVSVAKYLSSLNMVLSIRRIAMATLVALSCRRDDDVSSLFGTMSDQISSSLHVFPVNRVEEQKKLLFHHPTLWRQYKYDFFRVLLQASQDIEQTPSELISTVLSHNDIPYGHFIDDTTPLAANSTSTPSASATVTSCPSSSTSSFPSSLSPRTNARTREHKWDTSVQFCERLAWMTLPTGSICYERVWNSMDSVWRRELERFAEALDEGVLAELQVEGGIGNGDVDISRDSDMATEVEWEVETEPHVDAGAESEADDWIDGNIVTTSGDGR